MFTGVVHYTTTSLLIYDAAAISKVIIIKIVNVINVISIINMIIKIITIIMINMISMINIIANIIINNKTFYN